MAHTESSAGRAVPRAAAPRQRENWSSKLGVIMAVAGSAVGLGNFLRFPGLASANGGGVFMIPYFVSLLLLGIPICWVEWGLGRYGGSCGYNSAPGIFSTLWRHPASKYFGAFAIMIPIAIYMYYVYIESWCLTYAVDYARGSLMDVARQAGPGGEMTAYRNYFAAFVGVDKDGFPEWENLVILIVVFVLNFYLIFRGLTRGIESFNKYAMPVLILCALVILARVLTLGTPQPPQPGGDINRALGFMWNPRLEGGGIWSELRNPEIWLLASGQIFFSLSVGFGIILNYASYLRRNDDVVLSGLTASVTNEFCEVCLAGLITVPVAFLFLGPANLGKDVLGSSFALGFHAMPAVFARMPAGQLFGFLWFFMLFLAAITSSLSMLQPAIAFLEEGFNLPRRASVAILGFITAIGVLIVVFFSKNLLALDTIDFWVSTVCIFVLAMIQTILFAWIFGIRRARVETMKGADLKIPGVYWFIMKYVSPLYLLVIFVAWCRISIPKKLAEIGGLTPGDRHTVVFVICFLAALLLFCVMLVYLSRRRWDGGRHEIPGEEVIP
ncbi:MAG: sodium-dependent transporter [bacterium]|nr:sodium-dependent transporter [bacterium]